MIWIKKVITANSGAAIRVCHYMPNSVPPSWHNPVIIILINEENTTKSIYVALPKLQK